MNWGYRIILGFLLFAGFVFTLVYRMVTSGNDLVSREYYRSGEQVNTELKLQQASASMKKSFTLHALVQEGKAMIRLRFAGLGSAPEGKVTFTCLNSDHDDVQVDLNPVKLDSAWVQEIPLRRPRAGNWLYEIRGFTGGKEFLIRDEFQMTAYTDPSPN